jgi:hypothetical protein
VQAVQRNSERFPDDFMFRLTKEKFGQGVAMLSSVFRSKRAVQVNIEIMRAFVRLRRLLSTSDPQTSEQGP